MCDGDADADQLATAVAAASEAAEYHSPFIDAVEATCFEIAIEHLGIVAGALEAATAVARGVSSTGVQNPSGTYDRDPRMQAAERSAQCDILRDIFGNPFRPVAFDPAWRTSTVVALAQQMYDSRDFGLMPILGDALEDAGCDSADILDHCRGDGPHVRGCWVVDLVLGKS
jgi:hypothetical protein